MRPSRSENKQVSQETNSSSEHSNNSKSTTVENNQELSDVETDKMEGLDEKESDLEKLAGETQKRKLNETGDEADFDSHKRIKKDADDDDDEEDDENDEHSDHDIKKEEEDEQAEKEATRLQAIEELKDIETDFAKLKDKKILKTRLKDV
ncbi:unnamed protein product [Ambrosiozyma monospora]|uniref:Unnamed protein product n=1 Tax=Ambrosiozyma monospora TaxID=43982 RepID=A0ACB5UAI0_AMBMO|nr:unnamed protein product [Ambrosiozyma monospora]